MGGGNPCPRRIPNPGQCSQCKRPCPGPGKDLSGNDKKCDARAPADLGRKRCAACSWLFEAWQEKKRKKQSAKRQPRQPTASTHLVYPTSPPPGPPGPPPR